MEDETILVISIVLNISRAVLLFFKSTINSILIEWWKKRKIEKNEKIEKLNNLKTLVGKTTRYYITVLIDELQQQYHSEILNNPNFINRHSETVNKLGKVRKFTSKNSEYLEKLINNKNTDSIYKITEDIQDDSYKLIQNIENIIFK